MADAELATIARPYARAAFSRALSNDGGLDQWSQMLRLLAALCNAPKVRQLLQGPVAQGEKVKLLADLASDELTEEGRNLLAVLAERDRLLLLPTVARLYDLLKSNHEKTMSVAITSAFAISADQASELEAALHRRLQRSIKISTSVDKSLIGGVVIKTADTVIDGSVRGRLQKLSQALV